MQPDWWLLSRGAALQKGGSRSSGAADPKGVPKSLKNLSIAGSWAAADTSAARRPAPRYEHAVTLFRRRLYVIGGNYSACSLLYDNSIISSIVDHYVARLYSTQNPRFGDPTFGKAMRTYRRMPAFTLRTWAGDF